MVSLTHLLVMAALRLGGPDTQASVPNVLDLPPTMVEHLQGQMVVCDTPKFAAYYVAARMKGYDETQAIQRSNIDGPGCISAFATFDKVGPWLPIDRIRFGPRKDDLVTFRIFKVMVFEATSMGKTLDFDGGTPEVGILEVLPDVEQDP